MVPLYIRHKVGKWNFIDHDITFQETDERINTTKNEFSTFPTRQMTVHEI